MEIEELPDLKVNWIESYKYLAEPLLEYVWEVANHFLPDYEDVSAAPAIFANRYAERNLSVEERYERSKEMKTFKGTLEEYKKRKYRKLDDSFKEKFLTNEDLQNTINTVIEEINYALTKPEFARDYLSNAKRFLIEI